MIPESITASQHGSQPKGAEPDEQSLEAGDESASRRTADRRAHYCLDEQVGYLLRLANQRHLEIFNGELSDLTPTQLAVLARLLEHDSISQNELGRRVGIDAATINGVVDRLARKKLIHTETDDKDKRRLRIRLTQQGRLTIHHAIPIAQKITRQTLQSLQPEEAEKLIELLQKLQQSP